MLFMPYIIYGAMGDCIRQQKVTDWNNVEGPKTLKANINRAEICDCIPN